MKNKPKKVRKNRAVAKPNTLQYDEQYGYWSYYVNGGPIYDLNEVEINGNRYKVVASDNTEVSYEMGRQVGKNHVKKMFKPKPVDRRADRSPRRSSL